jgi:hypothetical protein
MRIAGAHCRRGCQCPRCDREMRALLRMSTEEQITWHAERTRRMFPGHEPPPVPYDIEGVADYVRTWYARHQAKEARAAREARTVPRPPSMSERIFARRARRG